jgi:hypothetical protein
MSLALDEHASWRAELLAPVRQLCARAGLATETGILPTAGGQGHSEGTATPSVLALRHVAADGSWDASVTVVRAQRTPPDARRPDGGYQHSGYNLDSPGELVYEVRVQEDDDGSGHGPRPLVVFELTGTAQAAADALTLWAARGALFRCEIPAAAPEITARQERRRFDHRQTAAAVPHVDTSALPPETADLAAAVDPALLSWFFPRERGGRFLRSALVALAPCRSGRPHLTGPWLTARAARTGSDCLVLQVSNLIPASQPHRWDATPWLWDRRHADALPMLRWQARDPAEVRTAFASVRHGDLAAALTDCGVRADVSIARLLAGEPTRMFRAELTEKWVRSLYAGLADVAPWRLAAAHQIWREGRDALGLRTSDPVTLFGLGGMGQARKPKVALDLTPAGPVLRLRFSGGSAVLPRSLWTIPPDLEAALRCWPRPRCQRLGCPSAAIHRILLPSMPSA